MADVKISALPTVGTVVPDTDVLPLVSGGVTTQATPADIVVAQLDDTAVTVAQGGSGATTFTAGYLVADATNPFDTVPTIPWDDVSGAPYIEVASTVASTALSSTPVLLKPATTVGVNTGINYDSATGEFTFIEAGNYSLSIGINCVASNSNQTIYWYAENNTGSGWVVNTNSGKSFALTNGETTQVFAGNETRRVAGQKVRYWIYATSANVSLVTTSLGTTGAITPAVRIQYAG